MATFSDENNAQNQEINAKIKSGETESLETQCNSSEQAVESKIPDVLPRNESENEDNVVAKEVIDAKCETSPAFDANQHPPDLFTGTFQEEQNTVPLQSNQEATDVYLSTSGEKFLETDNQIDDKITKNSNQIGEETLHTNVMTSETAGIMAEGSGNKQRISTNESLQIQTQSVSVSQGTHIEASEAASIAANLQGLDNQGQMYPQQPTYVLLQTGGDQESGGQPQVFLAMQTGAVTSADSQAYITLHPVSVEGQDLSGAFTAEGLNLQHAVLTQSGLSSDVPMELSQHVSLADIKGLSLGQSIDSHSQMYIPTAGQIVTPTDGTDPSGAGVITYIQPVNSLTGAHAQVLMAVAEDDTHSGTDESQLHAKRTSTAANNSIDDEDSGSQAHKAGNNLSSQSRRRLSNDPRTCDECGRTFKYPSDLKKHLQIHTDMKKFQCEDCCRCFRRLHQLNVHKRIHSGEKPYVCNRCGAEFRHDSTLTMHIRTRHDHLKPFSCDGCGKNFGRMSHLRKHQRNVCGKGSQRGNIFACKYCDNSFSRKADLRQHFVSCEKKPEKAEKDILAPATYSCEHCGKDFVRNYDFKRHQLSHTDEKPFACSHCTKNFKERSSLYKHVKRMHSLLTDNLIDSASDETIENEAAQRAIAAITSADGMTSPSNSTDIIVSLAHGIHSSSESDTIVTAHALAQAGIIESADQILQGSHTIAAADILNFPEVAAALGLNTANENCGQAMVEEQQVDSPSIITMATEDEPISAANLPDGMQQMDNEKDIKQFAASSLQLDSGGLIIDTNETSNQEEPMITNEHSDMGVHNKSDGTGTASMQHGYTVESDESRQREAMVVDMMKSEMGMELLKDTQIAMNVEKLNETKEFDHLAHSSIEGGKVDNNVEISETNCQDDIAMSIHCDS